MPISEVLVQLLRKYHLSQRTVASRAGINYVTLNRIINGYEFRVTTETIEKIANGIRCTREETDELFRAAGRVPQSLKNKFTESQRNAQLFRRLTELGEEKLDEVEKLLDELEKPK